MILKYFQWNLNQLKCIAMFAITTKKFKKLKYCIYFFKKYFYCLQ